MNTIIKIEINYTELKNLFLFFYRRSFQNHLRLENKRKSHPKLLQFNKDFSMVAMGQILKVYKTL